MPYALNTQDQISMLASKALDSTFTAVLSISFLFR